MAYLSYSSGAFDARSQRMARSAHAAGFDVTVYARLQDGLPAVEQRDGYTIVRTWLHHWLGFPILRTVAWHLRGVALRRAAEAAMAGVAPEEVGHVQAGELGTPLPQVVGAAGEAAPRDAVAGDAGDTAGIRRSWRRTKRLLLMFPLRPRGWAVALDAVAEPADIWHGMWAGSLPALSRLSHRHGGRTIYDARDVYLESRDFARAPRPVRALLAWIERGYANRVDRVITVNESYAELLERSLGVPRPAVVMNCPPRWTPPDPPPDHIRRRLGLSPDSRVALYQGLLAPERGIEQSMDAILQVPEAVLVLLGFGRWHARLESEAARAPYAGRVFVLPPVPPDELLEWTASADVSLMAIAPTTVNHRYTTPQKLFESMAAGVPVVASDLPGMAAIVRAAGCGVLVDPLSPESIAAGIREVVLAPAEERARRRRQILEVAHRDWSWEAQWPRLLELYRELLAEAGAPPPADTDAALPAETAPH